MTHRGPFQPRTFCDSVILILSSYAPVAVNICWLQTIFRNFLILVITEVLSFSLTKASEGVDRAIVPGAAANVQTLHEVSALQGEQWQEAAGRLDIYTTYLVPTPQQLDQKGEALVQKGWKERAVWKVPLLERWRSTGETMMHHLPRHHCRDPALKVGEANKIIALFWEFQEHGSPTFVWLRGISGSEEKVRGETGRWEGGWWNQTPPTALTIAWGFLPTWHSADTGQVVTPPTTPTYAWLHIVGAQTACRQAGQTHLQNTT